MKIAIVDERGETLSVAIKMAQLGHEVIHVAVLPAYSRIGTGLVQKAPSLAAILPQSLGVDLYAIFAPGLTATAQMLRQQGRSVIGGNAWVERLAWDRAFAAAIAESYNLRTLQATTYANSEEAAEVVRADPRKWVVSRAGAEPFSSDVAALLENHIRRLRDAPVTLSEYVPGIELYVETWFHQGVNVFTLGCLGNRHFLDGDLGPELETQTAAAWIYAMREPRVYQNVGKRLEVIVGQQKYTGPLGVRLLLSERDRKPYLLGFSASSGRHIHAARHALGFDLANFAVDPGAAMSLQYAYSAAVSVQPYPASCSAPTLAQAARGLTVLGREGGAPYIYLHDVEASSDGGVVVAGTSGLIADVVGVGDSVEEARREAIGGLDCLLVEGKQARRGGGAARLGRDVLRLTALGYETPKPKKVVA